MRKNLLTVLNYFGYFSYAPSYEEILTFFPHKISKKDLRSLLTRETKNKTILRFPKLTNNRGFRALQGFSNHYSLRPKVYRPLGEITSKDTLPQYSTSKVKGTVLTIQTYMKILKGFLLVRFVGVTGASAMGGWKENDDLDMCIVTRHNALWMTRFFVVALAKMLGIYNKKGLCLNLFFDESDLVISHKKQNSYIAHEILQMKPLIDKDYIYQRFLRENGWIYRYFPNAPHVIPTHSTSSVQAPVGIQMNNKSYRSRIKFGMTQRIDRLFKSIQLPIIHRNRAAFSITNTQLWLFKNDFEKKLKRRGLVI